jgi:hypothetical protein
VKVEVFRPVRRRHGRFGFGGIVVDREQMPAVMWVRFLPGVVGLTRRVVHVVPVPADGVVPERLMAYCGQPIGRGVAELLSQPVGAPCTECLLRWRLPEPTKLPV